MCFVPVDKTTTLAVFKSIPFVWITPVNTFDLFRSTSGQLLSNPLLINLEFFLKKIIIIEIFLSLYLISNYFQFHVLNNFAGKIWWENIVPLSFHKLIIDFTQIIQRVDCRQVSCVNFWTLTCCWEFIVIWYANITFSCICARFSRFSWSYSKEQSFE